MAKILSFLLFFQMIGFSILTDAKKVKRVKKRSISTVESEVKSPTEMDVAGLLVSLQGLDEDSGKLQELQDFKELMRKRIAFVVQAKKEVRDKKIIDAFNDEIFYLTALRTYTVIILDAFKGQIINKASCNEARSALRMLYLKRDPLTESKLECDKAISKILNVLCNKSN